MQEQDDLDNEALLESDEELKDANDLDVEVDGEAKTSKVKEESKKSAREISEKMAGKDIESSGEDSDGADDSKGLFINPLAVKTGAAKDDDEEEWSDDDSVDPKDAKGKKKKDKSLLGKRKRKGSMDGV